MAPTDFESWYRDEHPRLVSALAALSREPDLSRELADEAFSRALVKYRVLRETAGNPSAWVYRVGLNLLREAIRRRAIERRVLRRYGAAPAPSDVAFDFALWDLVARLSIRQREAVALRYAADLKEADIALAMRISRGTVSSLLTEAKANLRRMIAESEAEEKIYD